MAPNPGWAPKTELALDQLKQVQCNILCRFVPNLSLQNNKPSFHKNLDSTTQSCPQLSAGGIYVDGTFGRGGHTRAMLAAMSPSGSLHAFDMDPVLPTMHCKFFTDQMKLTTLGQEQCVTMHLYNHSHFSISFLAWIFILSNLTPGSHCSGQRTHAGAISLAES